MENYNFDVDAVNFTSSEKNILEYLNEHIEDINDMSIRKLADECYVSSATIFRFIKKIGFNSYNEFQEAIKYRRSVAKRKKIAKIPDVIKSKDYKENYLQNIIESVRVINPEYEKKFCECLNLAPKVYLFGHGLSRPIVLYTYQLLIRLGYNAIMVRDEFEEENILYKIHSDDLVMAFSVSGEDNDIIKILKQIRTNNVIVSFTKADNNEISMSSDYNFYFFFDEFESNNVTIASRVSMLAIVELLVYQAYNDKNS